MVANDYWTHIGLAVAFLVTVVVPRMFNPDYATFTAVYLVGGAILIGAATYFRVRSRVPRPAAPAVPAPREPQPAKVEA